jgi:Pyridoxal-phosphate dependent enzyme
MNQPTLNKGTGERDVAYRLTADSFAPLVELTALAIPDGHVHVVRDDLLAGGTKQRAAVPYLRELLAEGHREIVYASPFAGFAQVALASSARHLGLACTLFCEEDRSRHGVVGVPHPFSRLAESMGARVVVVPTLEEAELLAEAYANTPRGSVKIPLGLDASIFRKYLKLEIARQWQVVLERLGAAPRTLWLPVGSATLASAFRDIVPPETGLRCVDVRVLDPRDQRLVQLAGRPGVLLHATSETFSQTVASPPPLPSNAHYDAKLWAFIVAEGRDGDVWWNVAR